MLLPHQNSAVFKDDCEKNGWVQQRRQGHGGTGRTNNTSPAGSAINSFNLGHEGKCGSNRFTTRLGTAASAGRFTNPRQGPTISIYIQQSLNSLILCFFSLTSVYLLIVGVEGYRCI